MTDTATSRPYSTIIAITQVDEEHVLHLSCGSKVGLRCLPEPIPGRRIQDGDRVVLVSNGRRLSGETTLDFMFAGQSALQLTRADILSLHPGELMVTS